MSTFASSAISRRAWPVLAAALLLLGACRTPRQSYLLPADLPLAWPGPDSERRIEYRYEIRGGGSPDEGWAGWLGSKLAGAKDHPLRQPHGLCVDDQQRLWVVDSASRRIHRYRLDGSRAEILPADGPLPCQQPIAVAALPGGGCYLSDSAGGRVLRLDDEGRDVGHLTGVELERPTGLALNPVSGELWVVDSATHQIHRFLDDRYLGSLGGRGDAAGSFNFPTHICCDDRGRVHVTDAMNFRIQIFDAEGSRLGGFGEAGDAAGFFARPKGVAVDSEGHVYVVDALFDRVQVFDREGRLLLVFGGSGQGNGEFWLPMGIAINAQDEIFVTDFNSSRVQVFRYVSEVTG
jgi:sugar lactone lactonase YvrE